MAYHKLWKEGSGRFLDNKKHLPEAMRAHRPLVQSLYCLSEGIPLIEMGSQSVFESPRWGKIDLSHLNAFSAALYVSDIGQAQLFRDLSIILCEPRLGISGTKVHWGKEKDRIFQEHQWHNVHVSWRELLWYHQGIHWEDYKNAEGYDRFASEFYGGNSYQASKVAHSLLSEKSFKALNWGKLKQTIIGEDIRYRDILLAGIEDGSLQGEKGYDLFAKSYFDGNSQKAWQVASSLLTSKQFNRLKWTRCKYTYLDQEAYYRRILTSGIQDGTLKGKKGCRTFAEQNKYDINRACRIARSVLSDEKFNALNWQPQRNTAVPELQYQNILLNGIFNQSLIGEKGYDQFSLTYFDGNSYEAWRVAKSYLNKKAFKALHWKYQKIINIREESYYREMLVSGMDDGSLCGVKGYNKFASLEIFDGNLSKAYQAARSLLNDEQLARLDWGKCRYVNLSVEDNLRRALLDDDSFREELGYDKFATIYFKGSSHKAWMVASSILTKEEFNRLKWFKHKYTKVDEEERFRKVLIDGIHKAFLTGLEGRRMFEKMFKFNSHKAWFIARSVLAEEQFKALNWETYRS